MSSKWLRKHNHWRSASASQLWPVILNIWGNTGDRPFVPLNGALVRSSVFSVKPLNRPDQQKDIFYPIDNYRVAQTKTCLLPISDTFRRFKLKNSMRGTGPVTSWLCWVKRAKEQIKKEKKSGQFFDLDRMSQKWTAFDVLELPADCALFPGLLWSMVSIINIWAHGFFFFFLYAAYVQSIWLAQS